MITNENYVEHNVFVTLETKAKIKHVFERPSDTERCGVLLGEVTHGNGSTLYTVTDFVEVTNTAEDAKNTFSMTAGDVRTALNYAGLTQERVIGSIHSHRRGSAADPSWEDVEEQPAGSLGAVYHVTSKTVTYYNHEVGFIIKEKIK